MSQMPQQGNGPNGPSGPSQGAGPQKKPKESNNAPIKEESDVRIS
jgi:hypothetical protein